MDDETNEEKWWPRPKFETKIVNKDRINYQACLVGCVAKHQGEQTFDKL